ncbi:MAG: Fe-S cluster assembly protein SufD [Bacteroidetes bacterium]|nr:Fe-S cluster assembly protein SufD [Bacteroidota bacterium]
MSVEMNHYTNEFQTFQQNGAAKSPDWVNDVRTAALSVFTGKGFPTTKQEDWKYTNVTPIARAPFRYSASAPAVPAELVTSLLIGDTEQHLIVFVNGHFSAEHSRLQSLPAGLTVKNLIAAYGSHADLIKAHLSKYAPYDKNPFTALNTAFINDGAFIHAAKGTKSSLPVHLLFISTAAGDAPAASHIRNLIIAEEGAEVRIAHSFASAQDNTNLTNVVTEVSAGRESIVELVKVQRESEKAFHVEHLHVHQEPRSTSRVFSLAVGGAIARNEMSVIIGGETTECNLNGLYITSGEQLIDHHTFMHHIHPECPSHELFKGILMDKSRAVFNGKVYVEPEAQKTDSKQTNRNLLLSDEAVVDTKPELEIFADDVKCTHGAAVGGMNETHSFYLKTRGISEGSARGILTVGFAAEVTQKIDDPVLRRFVDTIVVDHLRRKFGTGNLPEIVHA